MIKKLTYLIIVIFIITSCTKPPIHDSGDSGDGGDEPEELIEYIPFETNPDWESTDISSRSTGLGVADINGDDMLDIIIANGNDMARQNLAVYYNDGNGSYPTTPDWTSSDIDYHGHLSVGDIDKDGYNDVAVSVYLGQGGFLDAGYAKVYFNNNGELESTPSWTSNDTFYTFSLKLGDIDNDGDLDLAIACGESYYSNPENNRIYLNNNGTLSSNPDWTSNSTGYFMDIDFADLDNDGDLDIVYAGGGQASVIYLNDNGSIQTTPYWQSSDSSNDSNSLMTGDIDNNGFVDIIITDNYQQGGTGKTKIYLNNEGSISTTPDWTSDEQTYGSGVFLYDITRDGYPEVIMGNWGENYNIGSGKLRIYENTNGVMNNTSDWVSTSNSVVEAITFIDVDMDGIITENETIIIEGKKSIFYLTKKPIQGINYIKLNDSTLSIDNYTYDYETGWISINKSIMITGDNNVKINYTVSRNADMIVSNWDSNVGNFLFYNTAD